MKKTVLLIMILTIFSKFIGFFRDVTLAYFYGASGTSDAYLIALTIPTVIFGFIASGISTGYIPMYHKIEEADGEARSQRFTSNLLYVLYVFCTGIVLTTLFFTEPLVKLFASGFEGSTLETAVLLTKITVTGIYFSLTIRILSAYLNMKKLFVVPTLLGLPLNAVLILSIIISHRTGIVVILALGQVMALAIQLVILLFFACRKSFRFYPVFDLKDSRLRMMLLIAVPVIFGSAITQLNKLVDRTIASQIAVGGISALNYANTLNLFVQGVFVVSITTVMFPMISKMAAKSDLDGMKKAVMQAITAISLLVLPATAGAMLFAEPIVALLFGRGAFSEEAVSLTASSFFFYSIGMIGYGLREVLSRAFYSMQDTRTPMINGAIAVGLNIILNLILSRFLGIGGLALATSISALFATALLFFSLQKKIGPFHAGKLSVPFLKIISASLVMTAGAGAAYKFLLPYAGSPASLMAAIFGAAALYFGLIYVLKVEGTEELAAALKRRFTKKHA